jgi:uncharacterized protein (DUF3820 family)
MEYLVFPFGKYKGEKLTDLPSTYIVLALEKFELPEQLTTELRMILYGRLNCWDVSKQLLRDRTKKDFMNLMSELNFKYPKPKKLLTWND